VIPRWGPLVALVLAQIGYPLASGEVRTVLAVLTVVLGFAVSVGHALATRGVRVSGVLVAVTAAGGLAVEAVGVGTGLPFGEYEYGGLLGPKALGVPIVIPLAWTWMAWPAWLVSGHLVRPTPARVALAGLGLAAWDLFLDPQMVDEGYWTWTAPLSATLPGVDTVPVCNYVGWLAIAVLMMAVFAATAGRGAMWTDRHDDAPMLALYVWTYLSSVLAHAVFLDLPASALWGGVGMGLVVMPLVVRLVRP
jgi:uncharacterized membrane protein